MKIIKTILSVLLVLTCNGCAKKDGLDPKNPITIQIWHYYNGPLKTSFDEMVEEFNNTVGIEKGIVVQAFSHGSVNDLATDVLASSNNEVGAKALPEIFAGYANTVYQVDQLGLVADISKYFTDNELAEYIDGYLQEGYIDGSKQLKIFPIAKTTELLMLNKTDWDLFVKENPSVSLDDLKTWESLVKVSQIYYEWTDSLTDELNDGKAFFGRDAFANYMYVGASQLGQDFYKTNNGKTELNINKEVLRKLWDNYYIPFVQGYYDAQMRFRSDDCKTGDILAFVGAGSGALYFPDSITVDDETSYPIESIVLAVPNFEGTEAMAVQQGAGMAVTKSDSTRELASVLFLKWFTAKERNIAFSSASGYLPVTKVANDPKYIEQELSSLPTMSEKLSSAIIVGVKTVAESKLYTSLTFDAGDKAREVVESSMFNLAKEDAADVKNKIASGITRQEALEKYLSDEYFEKWADEFINELKSIVE